MPFVAVALFFLAWERLRPARPLPEARGWTLRLLVANGVQVGLVLGLAPRLPAVTGVLLPLDALGPVGAAGVAYLASTLLWYGWHRARHACPELWLGFHQLHHSPARIESAMAFYKHPAEIVANVLLSFAVAGPLFGLGPAAVELYALLAFTAELFYHANVRTPRWLGWWVQRPEMHRLHHARGRHAANYGDIALWDLLFGTWDNPAEAEGPCGFGEAEEGRLWPMLTFRDAFRPAVTPRQLGLAALTALALTAVTGTVLTPVAPRVGPAVAGVGKLTLLAPFPKVFCRVGDGEPWAYAHEVELHYPEGDTVRFTLDRESADRWRAPYQTRNAYGAAVAYGAVLPEPTVRAVLRHGACETPALRSMAGAPPERVPDRLVVRSTPLPGVRGAPRTVEVQCSA